MAKDNNFLGSFTLEGIPPAPAGVPDLIVCMEIDANGILTVSTVEKNTRTKKQLIITGSGRLQKNEIDRLLEEAKQFKDQDEVCKKTVIAKNNLEEAKLY